jgi:hypothetical protein
VLIDELLAAKSIGSLPASHLERMQQRLKAAVKFELAPDFANTAETLAKDFRAISEAIPFCRLPFPSVWIEVAQKIRIRFLTANIHFPGIQKTPHRVGFLLQAMDKELQIFKVHQFWSFPDKEDKFVAEVASIFNPKLMKSDDPTVRLADRGRLLVKIEESPTWKTASHETKSKIASVIHPAPPDFPSTAFNHPDPLARRLAFEISAVDWSGESAFILGVLALLNTVNAHERVSSELTKLNKARVKRGNLPLQDYYLLKVSQRLKTKLFVKSDADSHRELRMHMVRGHWKVRKTGIYFWHPHFRGDKSKGVIEKDYQLT